MHYTTFGTSEELRDTLEVVLNPNHNSKKMPMQQQQSMIYKNPLLLDEFDYPEGLSPEPTTSPNRIVTGDSG